MEQTNNNGAVKKIAQEIKGIDTAMMTTISKEGTLHSRPMVCQRLEFDGELWFFTDINSVKVDELEADNRVNIAFSSPSDQRYVSISGHVDVRRDRKKIEELWSPMLKAWFPQGKDDPNIALLHVTPEVAEYWDVASRKLVQVAGFVKSVLTGQRPNPGKNEAVRF